MRSENSFCNAPGLEQTEAQQHRIAHTPPYRPGNVGGEGDALHQDGVDACHHHYQERLEAQGKQGFQVALPHAPPLAVADGGAGDRPLRGHKVYLDHPAVDHKHDADGKYIHRQPHEKGLEPQPQQTADVHSRKPVVQIGDNGSNVDAGIANNYPCALIDDALGDVKHPHDDVPGVGHKDDSGGGLEHPAKQYPTVHVVHIVPLRDQLYQLVAHDKGKDGPGDRDDHRFREVAEHIENAAVPALGRGPHVGGDLSHFGIHRVKKAGEVAGDAVDQHTLEPFFQPVKYHGSAPPFPRPPARGGRPRGDLAGSIREWTAGQPAGEPG